MKNYSASTAVKYKKLFFVLRLLLLLPILFLVVFYWIKTSAAQMPLKITAVQFDGGKGKADEDFVEVTNISGGVINLGDYRLIKITASSGKRYPVKSWASDNVLQPGEKYIWACSKEDGFPESIGADGKTKTSISPTNIIAIILDDGTIIDSFSKKSDTANEDDSKNNDENTSNENSPYLNKIKINEIYPAPDTKKDEKEFVEIENDSDKDIDFSTWCLKDETANKKSLESGCKKIDKIEIKENLSVLYGKFSLNNSSRGDAAFLYDDNFNLVDSRKYSGTKSHYAYAFDGDAWRWTSHPTPGAENIFDKKLSGKISRDKTVYKNIHATFSVKAGRAAKKFTWDFGDGHKSYLKNTRHKYAKTGTFHASLKIRGSGEDALYEFDVKVKKFDAPKIRIVKINPNPKGKDSENEWLEIENKSKHNINLKGWSIATGWDNLYNHPIRENFKIKKGKTKKLTRDICAFTLANTKTKIELRDPSGKVVQKITYDNGKKSITEDTLYTKKDSGSWEWLVPPETPRVATSSKTESVKQSAVPTDIGTGVGTGAPVNLGKYTLDPAWQKKQNYRIELSNYDSGIKIPARSKSQPRVLGARTVRNDNTFYSFTPPVSHQHWAVYFAEKFWMEINARLNHILNTI